MQSPHEDTAAEKIMATLFVFVIAIIPSVIFYGCSENAKRDDELDKLKYLTCMEAHHDHEICTNVKVKYHTHTLNGAVK